MNLVARMCSRAVALGLGRTVLATALLALIPSGGMACSLYRSAEFHLTGNGHASAKAPEVRVRGANFVPWISSDDTCGGVGFITIELSGRSAKDVDSYGVFVKALRGVNDTGFFPAYPLAPTRTGRGKFSVSMAWTSVTQDADGHVRWWLEVTPVSRSGTLGTPATLCVASDDSCPQLVLPRP